MRLYLDNAAASYEPSGWKLAWNDRTEAVTRKLGATKSGATATIADYEVSTSALWDVGLARFVSDALVEPVDFIAGLTTIRVCAVMSESDTAADLKLEYHLWVSQGDSSTVRGTPASNKIDVEVSVSLAGVLTAEWTVNADFTAQVGDRIVLELGYRASNTSATEYTGTLEYGGTGEDAEEGSASGTVGWLDIDNPLDPVPGEEEPPVVPPGGIVPEPGALWEEHFDQTQTYHTTHPKQVTPFPDLLPPDWWVRNVTNPNGYAHADYWFDDFVPGQEWILAQFFHCCGMLTVQDSMGILARGNETSPNDYVAIAPWVIGDLTAFTLRLQIHSDNTSPAWGIVKTTTYYASGPYFGARIMSDDILIELADYYMLERIGSTVNVIRVTGVVAEDENGADESRETILTGIPGGASANVADFDYYDVAVDGNTLSVYEVGGDASTLIAQGAVPFIAGAVGFCVMAQDTYSQAVTDYIAVRPYGLEEYQPPLQPEKIHHIWLCQGDRIMGVLANGPRGVR